MRRASPSDWVMGARSETGFVRAANEDRMGWTRTPYGDVFVVSDGMGGYRGGALAAEITVRTLQERLAAIPPDSERFSDHVRQAFLAANHEVHLQRQGDDPETREMGATGVVLVTSGPHVIVGHVGDSRAYLWRKGNGLRQLTRDHTKVQSMLDAGLLTPEQAAVHPDASVLDRAIGHQPTVQVDVTDWIELQPGDTLLLCSDGLCGYVSDAEIEPILRAPGTPQQTTDRLIESALAHGGHDNVTVQLARYTPPRSIGQVLLRPAVLVPTCVGVTALAAALGAWQLTAGYRSRIAQLTVASAAASSAPASASAATRAASAASVVAPVSPSAPSASSIALPPLALPTASAPAKRAPASTAPAPTKPKDGNKKAGTRPHAEASATPKPTPKPIPAEPASHADPAAILNDPGPSAPPNPPPAPVEPAGSEPPK